MAPSLFTVQKRLLFTLAMWQNLKCDIVERKKKENERKKKYMREWWGMVNENLTFIQLYNHLSFGLDSKYSIKIVHKCIAPFLPIR